MIQESEALGFAFLLLGAGGMRAAGMLLSLQI
jgi:hypothetical protein